MSAIFDIDGTLIIKGVQPNTKMIDLCNSTPDVTIITGRPEADRAQTTDLLHKYGIKYSALLMNDQGADPASQIRSKRMNAKEVLAKGPVDFAADNDQVIRSLYKTLGIKKVMA